MPKIKSEIDMHCKKNKGGIKIAFPAVLYDDNHQLSLSMCWGF